MKRILLVTQYFYPENFKSNDIAFELAKRGYQVDALVGIPNYPEGKYAFKHLVGKGDGVCPSTILLTLSVDALMYYFTLHGRKNMIASLAMNHLPFSKHILHFY